MHEETVCLELEEYSIDDLRKLFGLPQFGEVDDIMLKNAKKKVLMMHPDKSGLDKKYFQFYVKAYEKVASLQSYANRANSSCPSLYLEIHRKLEKEIEESQGLGEALRKAKVIGRYHTVGPGWSKWKRQFDEWFEQHGELSGDASGYEDFMKSTEDLLPEGATEEEARSFAEQRRKELGALVVHEGVKSIDSWNSFGSRSSGYGNGEDLRKAYTETVIPVTEDDFKAMPKYSSIDEYKRARHNAMERLDYESANKADAEQKRKEQEEDISQYYEQMKIVEERAKEVRKFQQRFLQLRDK